MSRADRSSNTVAHPRGSCLLRAFAFYTRHSTWSSGCKILALRVGVFLGDFLSILVFIYLLNYEFIQVIFCELRVTGRGRGAKKQFAKKPCHVKAPNSLDFIVRSS